MNASILSLSLHERSAPFAAASALRKPEDITAKINYPKDGIISPVQPPLWAVIEESSLKKRREHNVRLCMYFHDQHPIPFPPQFFCIQHIQPLTEKKAMVIIGSLSAIQSGVGTTNAVSQ